MNNLGWVTDIQRFCLHDGPGIRTTVFMGGCNLNCRWCHNPETILSSLQWQYFIDRCIHCGTCTALCPRGALRHDAARINRNGKKCTFCGSCVEGCYPRAIKMAGKAIHPKNLAEILLRDMVLYNNTGGATFSGGEPMLQTAFLITMLKRMKKEGINTAVDTAGCVSWTIIEAVSSYTDYFLYDVKAINSATHVKYTGRDNTLILDNLKALAKSGKVVIWIRVPLIRGINDNNEDIVQLGDFLRDLPNIGRLDILPYHNYGLYKSHSLGFQAEEFQRPDEDRLTEIKAILEQKDLTVHIN